MFSRLKDHLNREVTLNQAPVRIVSLVPSQTELLFELGLEDEVVGITKFCVHPANWKSQKEIIGGTKNLNISKIQDLNPDLILANKEENEKGQIESLSTNFTTWVSDVDSFSSAKRMIKDIGTITGKVKEVEKILNKIDINFMHLIASKRPISVAYLIWKNPFMTVGGDTFIHEMLSLCGFKNVFASKKRYPETTLQELAELECDAVLLSTEPYPFNNTHLKEIQLALPKSKVILADGEYFSWYGSRMVNAPAYFETIINKVEQ